MSDFLIELCQMQELLLQFINVCEKLVHFDRELMQENIFANLILSNECIYIIFNAFKLYGQQTILERCVSVNGSWIRSTTTRTFKVKFFLLTKLNFQETVSETYIICTCGLLKIPTV
ncbi:hypothetical protein BDFB_000645 [Asbolus verrucosus]|uniref:Uncharacterized protein n=1 Tax=Asbolus verrucosus TaxID=1661398 RepID=A0A482W9G8_ASBVE|nr:hypothetical protein BDFB_000645 [Asbolus verrucosus]